jgi:nicotinate-nucleotide pyrophosphorylase (carboxylating)
VDDGALAAARRAVVRAALAEDRAHQDLTTHAVVPAGTEGVASLVAREACVLAGLDAFVAVFDELGRVRIDTGHSDGDRIEAGATIARIEGPLRLLLAAERTALNLIQHLSGIATHTARFVEAARGVEVRDTRKTTPGLRLLEKAAVAAGGGKNHRMTLADQILIKDNHVAVAGGIVAAIERARTYAPDAWIEVECDTLDQVSAAVDAKADELLLDNMPPAMLTEAVALVAGRCKTEASGGINLETIREVAGTGVDAISVGALTHSAPAIDLSLEIEAV